jgi:hypothetical protein
MGSKSISLEHWTVADAAKPDAWTVDRALDDDLVTVLDRNDEAGVSRFLLGTLKTPITVSVQGSSLGGHTMFSASASHAIKTPEQQGAYRISVPRRETSAGRALHRAITGLTAHYRLAVEANHPPDESWLLPDTPS